MLNSKVIVELLVKKEVLLVTATPLPSVPLMDIVSGAVVSEFQSKTGEDSLLPTLSLRLDSH